MTESCNHPELFSWPLAARTLMLLLATLCGLALVDSPRAFACNNSVHCYSIINWNMNPSKGEEVYGAQAELETYYANVPLWEDGADFITNELWVGFENSSQWVEGGAVIGQGESQTSPYYFLAEE